MVMATHGMNRFPGYRPPNRGAALRILDAAERNAANARVIEEIRQLLNTLGNTHAVIPSRRIRAILKRHGL